MKENKSLAIAQLIGWHHFKMNGDRIVDLIASMGLTYSEWIDIKSEVNWLGTNDKIEIEKYLLNIKS